MIEYSALNKEVFCVIPQAAKTILDVGCGTGAMGAALKRQNADRIVHGITYSEEEAAISQNILDEVLVEDINFYKPSFDVVFDCMIFSHVLEHTYQPVNILKNFSAFLKPGGVVIIALPNVLQFKQRMEFFKGDFKYSRHGGLMDETHYRFFDWQSAQEMIEKSGLKIISKEASGHFPLFFLRRISSAACKHIDRISLKHWPGLFAFQFIFVTVK